MLPLFISRVKNSRQPGLNWININAPLIHCHCRKILSLSTRYFSIVLLLTLSGTPRHRVLSIVFVGIEILSVERAISLTINTLEASSTVWAPSIEHSVNLEENGRLWQWVKKLNTHKKRKNKWHTMIFKFTTFSLIIVASPYRPPTAVHKTATQMNAFNLQTNTVCSTFSNSFQVDSIFFIGFVNVRPLLLQSESDACYPPAAMEYQTSAE